MVVSVQKVPVVGLVNVHVPVHVTNFWTDFEIKIAIDLDFENLVSWIGGVWIYRDEC